MTPDPRNSSKGITYALLAFVSWGFLPVYWKLMKQIPSDQILAHRIIWSFVFVSALMKFRSVPFPADRLKSPRFFLLLLASGSLIALNWGLYIYAVNAGKITETSLGYYMNPLVSVLFGLLFLREKLRPVQWAALFLAFSGVGYLTFQHGGLPVIAVSLAITFALYGLIKKLTPMESLANLALETMLLFPAALIWLFLSAPGTPVTGTGAAGWGLLVLSGVVTALPLLWFGIGVKLIPLSMIGFFQYIGPSIALCLAVFVYGEPFTRVHLISFGLIWTGLGLYTLSVSGLLGKVSRFLR